MITVRLDLLTYPVFLKRQFVHIFLLPGFNSGRYELMDELMKCATNIKHLISPMFRCPHCPSQMTVPILRYPFYRSLGRKTGNIGIALWTFSILATFFLSFHWLRRMRGSSDFFRGQTSMNILCLNPGTKNIHRNKHVFNFSFFSTCNNQLANLPLWTVGKYFNYQHVMFCIYTNDRKPPDSWESRSVERLEPGTKLHSSTCGRPIFFVFSWQVLLGSEIGWKMDFCQSGCSLELCWRIFCAGDSFLSKDIFWT